MLGKMAKEMPGINSKQDALGSQEEEVRVIPFKSNVWTFFLPQMNMDEVGDAIPETGGTDAAEKTDPNAGERCPGLERYCKTGTFEGQK